MSNDKKEGVKSKQKTIEVNIPSQAVLSEAAKFLKPASKSKFVGSVDIDILLNLKEKQKKEVIRGSVVFPNSFGEDKKVIVFCEEKDVKKALSLGAAKAGLEDLMEEVLKGFTSFDIVVATPAVMPKIVKLGKVLGPKGLMPNPKNGTISTDLEKTIESFKSGKINFKSTPDQATIRLKVAKVDMEPEKIAENITALLKAVFIEVKKLSPNPFKKIVVSPTMGSGIKLDINDIMQKVQ